MTKDRRHRASSGGRARKRATPVKPATNADATSAAPPPAIEPVTVALEARDLGGEPDDLDDVEGRATFEPRGDVAEISAYVPPFADDALGDDFAAEHGELIAFASPDEPPTTGGGEGARGIDAELRAVEAEVDRIFQARGDGRRADDASALRSVVEKIREVLPVELPGEDGGPMDAVKDVLSTDYYLRQWGRIGLRNRSEEVDEFGLDPVYEQRFRPLVDFLYKHWFRVEVEGIENVPEDGRCIVVANHSGVLPYDGIIARAAMRRAHPAQRELRWLAEDFVFHLPFLGAFMNRIGAVRACQENAERLLRQERCVLVFPEGIKGIGKLYDERYRLQRFGRGGFIKLALRTRSPIVPLAIVGAEESAPMLYRIEYLTEALGLPFVPITPTFPALGPLGLVPAPTKWKLVFGPPIDLEGHGAEAADDALLVGRLSERVRTTIQKTLDGAVDARRSVWTG